MKNANVMVRVTSVSSYASMATGILLFFGCSGGGDSPAGPTPAQVESVQLSTLAAPMLAGEKVQLVAVTRAPGGGTITGRSVSWSSSNGSVARVNSAGEVEAVGVGQAQITAESEGKKAEVAVAVTNTQLSLSADTYGAGTLGYSSYRAGNNQIDAFTIGPTGLRQVTAGPEHDRITDWSPDGERIGITRNLVSSGAPVSSHTIALDGTNEARIFDGPANWSRDWSKFAGTRGGQIVISKADGTGQFTVIGVQGTINGKFWSPDGTKLAFSYGVGAQKTDMYVMNADGTGIRNVTGSPDRGEPFADWSPDGTKLMIEAVNPDGSTALYIAEASGSVSGFQVNGTGSDPRWSPDGSKILFKSLRGGEFAIYMVAASGGAPSRITPPGLSSSGGRWSTDGTRIAFTGTRSGPDATDVFVITADRSSLLQVTDHATSDFEPVWKR